jgi:hypothetical protein
MGRPRKDAPPPETRLVALRLARELLAAVDAHAGRAGSTRSEALRDLLVRGLAASAAGKGRAGARPGPRACAWCRAVPGAPHLEGCPRRPDAPLRAMLLPGRRRRRR